MTREDFVETSAHLEDVEMKLNCTTDDSDLETENGHGVAVLPFVWEGLDRETTPSQLPDSWDLEYDRHREFVIDDAPVLGTEVFIGTKNGGIYAKKLPEKVVMAVVARGHGNKKFARVLRFMYTAFDY